MPTARGHLRLVTAAETPLCDHWGRQPWRRVAWQSAAERAIDPYFSQRPEPGPLKCRAGERVAYTRYFLLSVGAKATDPRWGARATVVACEVHSVGGDERTFVVTHWDGETSFRHVNPCILAHAPETHPDNLRYSW